MIRTFRSSSEDWQSSLQTQTTLHLVQYMASIQWNIPNPIQITRI
jgi:hypothetical protein